MGQRRSKSKERISRMPPKHQPDGGAYQHQSSGNRQLRYASGLSQGSHGSSAGRGSPVNDEEQRFLKKLLQVKAPTREELICRNRVIHSLT